MWFAVLLAVCILTTSARYHDRDTVNLIEITHNMKGGPNYAEHTQKYWHDQSISTLRERLERIQRDGIAKNIIMFLGDGMSIATITAARIYLGQLTNQTGEEQKLSFEKFPYTGLSKTYCVDSQVADSACTTTAYLSGVKTNIKTIGVTADVAYLDWKAMQNKSLHTTSIIQWAQDEGKGTGIVTTSRVTDASPVGAYGHTASRYWQTDADIKKDAPEAVGVQDISTQLIENIPGSNLKVIMGGGRQVFLPKEKNDGYGNNGTRGDGKDLIEMWKSSKDAAKVNGTYITNRDQLLNLDVDKTDYLMGLFHHDHMEYHLLANATLQPTLAEMTTIAIKMMQKEANGYFLFIEGGKIDHGHHDAKAHLALDEAVEFHKAIQVATAMTSEEDTLMVVTADHAHTMTISGYPTRGSDIFTTLQTTDDSLSYPTLSYANGPAPQNVKPDGTRHNLVNDDRGDKNYVFPSTFNLSDETHDGQDVAVYARGPSAHLFVGNYEQTLIPMAMGYAARIGPAAKTSVKSSGQVLSKTPPWALFLMIALIIQLFIY